MYNSLLYNKILADLKAEINYKYPAQSQDTDHAIHTPGSKRVSQAGGQGTVSSKHTEFYQLSEALATILANRLVLDDPEAYLRSQVPLLEQRLGDASHVTKYPMFDNLVKLAATSFTSHATQAELEYDTSSITFIPDDGTFDDFVPFVDSDHEATFSAYIRGVETPFKIFSGKDPDTVPCPTGYVYFNGIYCGSFAPEVTTYEGVLKTYYTCNTPPINVLVADYPVTIELRQPQETSKLVVSSDAEEISSFSVDGRSHTWDADISYITSDQAAAIEFYTTDTASLYACVNGSLVSRVIPTVPFTYAATTSDQGSIKLTNPHHTVTFTLGDIFMTSAGSTVPVHITDVTIGTKHVKSGVKYTYPEGTPLAFTFTFESPYTGTIYVNHSAMPLSAATTFTFTAIAMEDLNFFISSTLPTITVIPVWGREFYNTTINGGTPASGSGSKVTTPYNNCTAATSSLYSAPAVYFAGYLGTASGSTWSYAFTDVTMPTDPFTINITTYQTLGITTALPSGLTSAEYVYTPTGGTEQRTAIASRVKQTFNGGQSVVLAIKPTSTTAEVFFNGAQGTKDPGTGIYTSTPFIVTEDLSINVTLNEP